jgi:hypothetical protein
MGVTIPNSQNFTIQKQPAAVATATPQVQAPVNVAPPKESAYEAGLKQSMGANAADTMAKGQQAAQANAAQAADVSSTQAVRKAIQAAKTAGVNRGQAAMIGGQQAGDAYTNTYQGQLEAGQNRYQQATGQFANMTQAKDQNALQQQQLKENATSQAKQLELQAKQLEMQGKQAEADAKRQEAQSFWNTVGSIAGAVGSIFMSDEKFKENVKPDSSLDAILRKIKPVSYNYKGEDKKQVGITAQNLEDSPLAGAVMDTPAGKVVDGAQLEGSNLALIIELAGQVRDLQRQLKGGK